MSQYDLRYIHFLSLFQQADYYTCHDVMEDLWLEEGRDLFYQGLLQVAVGLYHFQNQNIGGACKLLTAAREKLANYPANWLGVDVEQLCHDIRRYVAKLARFSEQPFVFYPIHIQITEPDLQQRVKMFQG